MPDPCVAIPHARFNHDHFHTHVQYAQTDTSHQETPTNGITGKKSPFVYKSLRFVPLVRMKSSSVHL